VQWKAATACNQIEKFDDAGDILSSHYLWSRIVRIQEYAMTEETLFQEALSRPTEERAAFLDGACAGKPELRAAVESLLAAHQKPDHILDKPPVKLAAPADPEVSEHRGVGMGESPPQPGELAQPEKTGEYRPDAAPGAVIAGRYTLQEKIGEGGMGEVWVAKQSEPVKRRVALKLIKAGMDSKAVLQRFEQERQALALMDHPNIAKVLDGGLTQDRRPFFVMELVNGLPLTRFCDEAKLDIQERLELFTPVCQAVQHAHQKGIVHRDLKPANILVTIIDGRPVPKVIDFGVAKATSGRLTDESLSTQFGAVVGTLEYMAPEQAAFSGEDVDTRADIYSLGVILYELLTGLRPFDGKKLKAAAFAEMIRVIKEEEPSKPSTRLSTDASAPSLATLRDTEPKKLAALLRRELDWVVMKCLEKQRDRRYETANALARDIQRYLANEVVEARPPSAGYRVRKFVTQHKGQVVAVSLVLLALLAGLTAVAVVQTRAKAEITRALENETKANRELGIANESLSTANTELARSKVAVQARYDLAVQAIKTFHTGVSEDFLLREPQFKELRDRLLNSAADFYRKLAALLGKETDVTSRRALEQSNFELAELTGKVGRIEAALAAHQATLAAREALAAETGASTGIKADVGRSLTAVAHWLYWTGKANEGIQAYRRAESLLAGVADSDPEARAALAACRTRMARPLLHSGKTTEALAACKMARADQEALASVPGASIDSRRDFTATLNELGIVLWQTNKPAQAEPEFRAALLIQQKLADENPAVVDIQNYLANIHLHLGNVLRLTGKLLEAEAEFREAMAIYQKLIAQYPAITRSHRNLALCRSDFGFLLSRMGRLREAEAEQRSAITILQRLTGEDPANTDARGLLANSHRGLAQLLALAGKPAEAEAECRTALAIDQKLAGDDPKKTFFRSLVAESRVSLGHVLLVAGKPGEAEAECRMALAIFQELAAENPDDAIAGDGVASSLVHVGDVDRLAGRTGEARSEYERAIALFELPVLQNPKGAWHRYMLVCALRRRGLILRDLGDPAGAAAEARRALGLCDRPGPQSVEQLVETACCHALLAGVAGRAGSGVTAAEGDEEARSAIKWLRRAIALGYRNVNELQIESALAPLRNLEDFKKLVAELEAKKSEKQP
jgi:tetratricopeptide (TPR) repeat protein/tRNA A-37 threonylcarbamoyl transferase component Bud32